MRAATTVLLLASVGAAVAQSPFSDPLGGPLERPVSPPLLSLMSLAAADGAFMSIPYASPVGDVSRVVVEEYSLQPTGRSQAREVAMTWTREFDSRGQILSETEKTSGRETKTVATYKDDRILTRETTTWRDGKQVGATTWSRWTYNDDGRVIEFKRGSGEKIQNYFTNFRYDQAGRLTSLDYHQGADDALATRTEYKYSDGKIEVDEFDHLGDQYSSQIRSVDRHGRITTVELRRKDWASKKWQPPVHVSFQYDSKNRLVEQSSDDAPALDQSGSEFDVPPGAVKLSYDDEKHTRRAIYAYGGESIDITTQLDDADAIVGMQMVGPQTVEMTTDCTYDDHKNWTECRRWGSDGTNRHEAGFWRRSIIYR